MALLSDISKALSKSKLATFRHEDLQTAELSQVEISNNWEIKSVEHAVNKNFKQQLKLAGGYKKLITDVNKNFKNISLQELSSSRSIIIAKKIK